MQVPNGTGPGVQMSKRPLSACHIRRKYTMETSHNSLKGRARYKRSCIGKILIGGECSLYTSGKKKQCIFKIAL